MAVRFNSRSFQAMKTFENALRPSERATRAIADPLAWFKDSVIASDGIGAVGPVVRVGEQVWRFRWVTKPSGGDPAVQPIDAASEKEATAARKALPAVVLDVRKGFVLHYTDDEAGAGETLRSHLALRSIEVALDREHQLAALDPRTAARKRPASEMARSMVSKYLF